MTDRKKQMLLIAGSILGFAALAVLFPYTGDDWDWGCHIGMDRLRSFFADYNGRYLGNLMVITQTRFKGLDVVVKALCCALAPVLCARYSEKRDSVNLLFALALFLIMPRGIFAQSVVWTAGFVNYVPSALISAGYLVATRNACRQPLSGPAPGFFWGSFLAGLAGAWFMENITLFNICLGVAVVLWLWWKHRRVLIPYLGFPAGAVLGCAAMFANSGYRAIAQGEDFYRQTPQGLLDTVKFMADNLQKILESLILNNWAMCMVITALLLALVRSRKNCRGRGFWMAAHVLSLVAVLAGRLLLTAVEGLALSETMVLALSIGVTVACSAPYVVTVFVLAWQSVDDGERLAVLLPLGCVVVCMAPLLVVRPIGDRCMFPGYLLLMMFLVALFDLARSRGIFPKGKERLAVLICAAVIVLQTVHLFGAYSQIHVRDRVMNDYARLQSEAGARVIRVTDLSEEGYVHCSYPLNDIWWNRYCLFYGLNTETWFEVVPWEAVLAEAGEMGIQP